MKASMVQNIIAREQHRLEYEIKTKEFMSTLMVAYNIVTLHKLAQKPLTHGRKAEWDVTEEQLIRYLGLNIRRISHVIDDITFEDFIKAVIDDREL